MFLTKPQDQNFNIVIGRKGQAMATYPPWADKRGGSFSPRLALRGDDTQPVYLQWLTLSSGQLMLPKGYWLEAHDLLVLSCYLS